MAAAMAMAMAMAMGSTAAPGGSGGVVSSIGGGGLGASLGGGGGLPRFRGGRAAYETLASSSSSHSNLPAVSALSKEGRTSVWSDSFRSSSSSTRSIVTLDDIKRSVELQDFKRSKLFV